MNLQKQLKKNLEKSLKFGFLGKYLNKQIMNNNNNSSIDEEPDTREGISKQDRDFDEDI